MSFSPEYYKFRDALRAEQAAKLKLRVRAIQGCIVQECDCGQQPTIVVFPTYLDCYADLEALIVCLRAAAVHAWGPP